MIRYREIQPSARLRTFVASFWLLEHDGLDAAPQRVVPDGRAELIINWGEPFESFQEGQWRRQPQFFFAGQITRPLLLRPAGRASVLGIRFHPHGAAAILAPPMHELTGRITPLQTLSNQLSRDLADISECADPVAAAESALLNAEVRVNRRDEIVGAAIRQITHTKGAVDLDALGDELGLGTRQLERRFRTAVGLSPKLMCRIARFNAIFASLEHASPNWAEIAVACGYYDQSHLIRDCKTFSGATPAVLCSEEADLARYFYRR